MKGLEDGTLSALSIGMKVNDDAMKTGKCTKIRPFEISLCSVPGRKGSMIETFMRDRTTFEFPKWEVLQDEVDSQKIGNEGTMSTDKSRIIDGGDAGSETAVNASEEGTPLERVLKRVHMTEEEAAMLLNTQFEAHEAKRQKDLDAIHERIKGRLPEVKREDLNGIKGMSLSLLAAYDNKFAEMELERAKTETLLGSTQAVNKNLTTEVEVAKKQLNEVKSKLTVAAAGTALTTPAEQFNKQPAAAQPAPPIQPAPVVVAEGGVSQPVYAAGDTRAYGLQPVPRPRSIFANGYTPCDQVPNLFDIRATMAMADGMPRDYILPEKANLTG